jgi:hypothetical protein
VLSAGLGFTTTLASHVLSVARDCLARKDKQLTFWDRDNNNRLSRRFGGKGPLELSFRDEHRDWVALAL